VSLIACLPLLVQSPEGLRISALSVLGDELGRLVDTLALLHFDRKFGQPRILSAEKLLPAAIGFLMEDRGRRMIWQEIGAVEINDHRPIVLETRVPDGVALLVETRRHR